MESDEKLNFFAREKFFEDRPSDLFLILLNIGRTSISLHQSSILMNNKGCEQKNQKNVVANLCLHYFSLFIQNIVVTQTTSSRFTNGGLKRKFPNAFLWRFIASCIDLVWSPNSQKSFPLSTWTLRILNIKLEFLFGCEVIMHIYPTKRYETILCSTLSVSYLPNFILLLKILAKLPKIGF